MLHTMFYSDWIYRPRAKEELMQDRGGSIVRRQGPIQVDITRMIGGGRVRSVRGRTNIVDTDRPIDGSFTAFVDFEEGHTATITYDGYGHFNSAELTFGYTLQGTQMDPALHVNTRRRTSAFANADAEEEYKDSTRYGGSLERSIEHPVSPDRRHAFFGLTLVSCERGDMRQTPTGLIIHGDDSNEEIDHPRGPGLQPPLLFDRGRRDVPRHPRGHARSYPRRVLGQGDAGGRPRHHPVLGRAPRGVHAAPGSVLRSGRQLGILFPPMIPVVRAPQLRARGLLATPHVW